MNEDWSDREIDAGEAVDREIERLKRVYKEHAETLSALAGSAPTKVLARKYRELIAEVNRSILGLDDPGKIVSGRTAEKPLERPTAPGRVERPDPIPTGPPGDSPADVRLRTAPGTYVASDAESDHPMGRIGLILGLAAVVIVLLAVFVWKYGSNTREEKTGTQEIMEPAAPGTEIGTAESPAPAISASPEAQDFGLVYKGTRVVKDFEVFNNTDADLTIEVERSQCRCLWFDYPSFIPAGGKVSISVAVDASRADEGLLSEGVVISTTDPPLVTTEVQVTAEIR